jgi:putative nucleotidyltransferase with HDIG domain
MNKSLALLKLHIKDYSLIQHSVMVGTIAYYTAEELGYDRDLCLSAGLLHDVGKSIMPSIYYHAVCSYDLLSEFDERVAILALHHHQFQKEPFPRPQEMPAPLPIDLLEHAQLIALCDKVEAYMARSGLNPERAIDASVSEYPDLNKDIIKAVSRFVG